MERPGQVERVVGLVRDSLDAGPGRRSSDYSPPSQGHARAVADAVAALAAGRDADPPPGYRLSEVPGEHGGPALAVLQEEPRSGRVRGHGVYVVRPGAGSELVVQVPHPVADASTEVLGPRLFELARADVLMVAGAHRTAGDDAADVANVPGSVFAAVDEAVVRRGSLVLQVHGFAAESYPRAYGDVVLSSTTREPSPVVRRLAERLRRAGFEVCVHEGRRCRRLAGTHNVQSSHARSVGAEFVHVELADRVRRDTLRSDRLLATLAEAAADEQPLDGEAAGDRPRAVPAPRSPGTPPGP